VRSVLHDALSVYEIELERLEASRPDVIVTQDLCDVCAVSFDDVRAATAALVHQPVRIVNLHPSTSSRYFPPRCPGSRGAPCRRGASTSPTETPTSIARGRGSSSRWRFLAACLHPETFEDLRRKHGDSVIRLDADLKRYLF